MTTLPPSHDDFDIVPGVDGRGISVRHRVTVEWGDCDPAGIIFYPTYFRWWDQGTWRLFRAIGLDRRAMRDDMGGVEMPILEAAGAFLAPVTPGDAALVTSTVERWGNSSFRVAHAVARLDGAPVASGHETRCWTKAAAASPASSSRRAFPTISSRASAARAPERAVEAPKFARTGGRRGCMVVVLPEPTVGRPGGTRRQPCRVQPTDNSAQWSTLW